MYENICNFEEDKSTNQISTKSINHKLKNNNWTSPRPISKYKEN